MTTEDETKRASGRGTGRERILRAAAEVFAERGYEGARVQEIAKRAGMTTGAIYAHFAGRHELLLAATGLQERTTALEQLEALGDLDARQIIATIGPALASDPDLGMRPMAMEALVAARREPRLHEVMRQRVEASNEELAALIARGQREGSLTEDLDPATVAKFFNALLVGVAALAPVWDEPLSEDGWRLLLERLLEGMAPELD
ncbi:TetR/AcrR family transcriptional regulator [Ornithinicoccus halotolerans]|uniref:TetR/AcrR family transcriptional regulator n=1 Tax=Ornithinicoccus halotolerans TaxID=1748220 RepID=UPI0012953202|nr:TetR/AcrR family transcriptional regulator [Ornithinicoccus halotolerans]